MVVAKEILDKYVKEEVRGEVGVIAIGRTTGRKGQVFWYHIHEDEEVPET